MAAGSLGTKLTTAVYAFILCTYVYHTAAVALLVNTFHHVFTTYELWSVDEQLLIGCAGVANLNHIIPYHLDRFSKLDYITAVHQGKNNNSSSS